LHVAESLGQGQGQGHGVDFRGTECAQTSEAVVSTLDLFNNHTAVASQTTTGSSSGNLFDNPIL